MSVPISWFARHSFGESQKNQKDFGGWRNSYYKCALREFFLWKSYKERHCLPSVTGLIKQLAPGRTKVLKQSPSPKPPNGIDRLVATLDQTPALS